MGLKSSFRSMGLKSASTLRSVYNSTKLLLDENAILALWLKRSWGEKENWGNDFNPIIIHKISGKKPLLVTRYTYNVKRKPIYSVIGSTLGGNFIRDWGHGNVVVWGTGFLSTRCRLEAQPKEICAVRGPLTREMVLKQGYQCPEIFGDPILLFPRYYKPKIRKKYKLGIICHYEEKYHTSIINFQNDPEVLIIDTLGGIYNIIDQICSCQKIASSSLQGLIVADAYGIQSTWITFSDNVERNEFKFFDYFKSVGRNDKGPLVMQEKSSIDGILDTYYQYKVGLNLNELMDACPFRLNCLLAVAPLSAIVLAVLDSVKYL